MPCTYYSEDEIRSQLHAELNRATALLCTIATLRGTQSVPEFEVWWAEHQEQDRRREAAEQENRQAIEERDRKRQAALDKLTPEERKVLGIR